MSTQSMYPKKPSKSAPKENNSKYIKINPTSTINIYVLNLTSPFAIILQPPKNPELHWEPSTAHKLAKLSLGKLAPNMSFKVKSCRKSRASPERPNLRAVISIRWREWQVKALSEWCISASTEVMAAKSQLRKSCRTRNTRIDSIRSSIC